MAPPKNVQSLDNNDEPSSPPPPHLRPKKKGILSLIPDHPVIHYKYDAILWNGTSSIRRKRRRTSRRHTKETTIIPTSGQGTIGYLSDIFPNNNNTAEDYTTQLRVVICLLDLQEAYSIRLLEKLVRICHPTYNDNESTNCHFRLLIATQNNNHDDDELLLMGSGGWKIPSHSIWLSMIGFVTCPAVAVLDGKTGIKFTDPQEELAIEWNTTTDDDGIPAIRQRWIQKQSAFQSNLQKIQAKILFPSACQLM